MDRVIKYSGGWWYGFCQLGNNWHLVKVGLVMMEEQVLIWWNESNGTNGVFLDATANGN